MSSVVYKYFTYTFSFCISSQVISRSFYQFVRKEKIKNISLVNPLTSIFPSFSFALFTSHFPFHLLLSPFAAVIITYFLFLSSPLPNPFVPSSHSSSCRYTHSLPFPNPPTLCSNPISCYTPPFPFPSFPSSSLDRPFQVTGASDQVTAPGLLQVNHR